MGVEGMEKAYLDIAGVGCFQFFVYFLCIANGIVYPQNAPSRLRQWQHLFESLLF